MAYADFSLERVQETFGLSVVLRPLFADVQPVNPTPWLLETLRRGQSLAAQSEKARGELIVMPILLTSRELLSDAFVIYSGTPLNVDPDLGLRGECDYILSRSPTIFVFQGPLMVIVEAKKNDIEVGLGQCAAQLVAARMFNERHRTPISKLYGCVTTGETWQFVEMEEKQLFIDTQRYFINDLARILGILTKIMASPPEQTASDAA